MPSTEPDHVEPEIRTEADYMETCRSSLARMREEVHTMLVTGAAQGDVGDKVNNHALRTWRVEQVEALTDLEGVPLFFGRLDLPRGDVYDTFRDVGWPSSEPDSDRVYIGRRGVSDEAGELLVIDWRAPLSRAFYEAGHADPMRVRVRRRFGFDHEGVLSAYEDEPLDGAADERGGALLAAEIERPRKGPMRDIVATIQPEQMSLVRAPLERTLCIQGAPGTGKTAVGLHRLAFLLFSERERLRKDGGVAVIGPNRSFLAYVRNVLPALGEVQVWQTTIDELVASVAVEGVDAPAAARIKGDVRMADVVRRQVWSRVATIDETLVITHEHRTWRLYPDELAEELAAVRERVIDYGSGQELLAQRFAYLVLRQIERSGDPATTSTLRKVRRHRTIARAAQRMWPTVDPAKVVFDLLTDRKILAGAAEGILSADEQDAILLATKRPRSAKAMTWTGADLALLDEAAALIEHPAKLGHIVVDEAQDLSPMQIRAIGRRVAGSCTVLGDLAQATSPSAIQDWAAALTHLGAADGQIEELTRGYRVPAQVIDYAARLLPHIAPQLRGPASFRQSADALRVTRVAAEERTAAVVHACITALTQEGSVGLIAADGAVSDFRKALTDSDLPHIVLGDDESDMDDTRLTLAPVTLAKGLEFDTVLVIEPAQIAAAEQRGLQRLYVALTRAVSNLHILHAEALPEPLTREPVLAV
ncbi:HelD family protein [Nocardia callitridis]|uniref:AAA family ATPase n=1 Tax=Nocardia callitridis TaxID=648753 RepID=A0ABP9KUX4_9NOCA